MSTRAKYAFQACQECRRRRAKCDGERPSCARCVSRSVECRYTVGANHRGTAPKSLVALLQSRIKLLEQVLLLHSIDLDASVAQLRARGTTSFVADEIATECDGSLNFGGDGEARYFGASSGRLELQSSGTTDAGPISSDAAARHLSALYHQARDQETEIPVELMNHLVDLYFEWEQPWFQVVDEALFRQSWQTGGRYCSPLLLNCIFAIGSRYSDREEVRSCPEDPNTAGQLYLEVAEVLLHFDLKSPSITTIQSLAIMAMCYVATGFDAKGWLRHGMAIRLALDMGLNLDHSNLVRSPQLPAEEVNLRRQIYWALYCTDKLWASYTGRVCTMLDFQTLVSLPSTFSSVTIRDSPRRTSLGALHYALCTQCQILEKILVNLWRLPPGIRRQAFFESCLLELKTWKYDLPVGLTANDLQKGDSLAHIYILHMVYHTSIILLAKPFLSPTSNPPHRAGDPSLIIQINLCMEAARDICLLGNKYREIFGSFRRSPVTATHCTLSAALVLLQVRDGGKKSYGPSLQLVESCILTLKELSDSWMPAQNYCRGLQRILKRTHYTGSAVNEGAVSHEDECHDNSELESQDIDQNQPFIGSDLEDMDFVNWMERFLSSVEMGNPGNWFPSTEHAMEYHMDHD
ncbi:hypothetical protein BO94DRAFT_516614 [Aspergillus sclerotioniger CBS 115572]|uniref:Zn(2)-C6 fungal-type domain-containing protein n=1 Tax=Aspergillus sclerotioniger CBS 115572 TaxID=1450535 RepID=A0A317WSJ1_9EURO|nr:hypothetical protein BO94DRAFT_516614 [Aspergillus sclerotioniger CBS 115572]PWY88117.1 hypothetical protein BO94DRAFT_516614 [Aspergillus sclerotioniger CBS 115572]